MTKLKPKDLIAFVLILGVFVLNYKGIDAMLSPVIMLIVGYYFGDKNRDDTMTGGTGTI